MNHSPDAYLLHESNRFITFNIRIKVVMKEDVVPDVLKAAAEKAFRRFPYYSKQIRMDEDGGIDLIPNPRTVAVNAVSEEKTYLFSEKVNYQPCSIEYEGNCIYFNMYHGMCGGCGTFLWIKTTVYEYICARYGVSPEPGTTIMTDTPISPDEYAFRKICPMIRLSEALKKTMSGSPDWNICSASAILFSKTAFIMNSRSPKRRLWNSSVKMTAVRCR